MMSTPRTVAVELYESPWAGKEEKFRLVFVGYLPIGENGRRALSIFQITLFDMTDAEVANGFRLLYNMIKLMENGNTNELSRISTIITHDLDCFRSQNFKNTLNDLRVEHSIIHLC